MEVHPLLWLRIHKVSPEAARWLKEEATEWFMNHYHPLKGCDLEYKEEWLRRKAGVSGLSGLFIWSYTPQGPIYWMDIRDSIARGVG
jgi:hypothetical protein